MKPLLQIDISIKWGSIHQTVRELDDKNKLLSTSYTDLKEVSKTDSLTGTYNRRYGDIVLEKLYLDFKNNNNEFSIMLADIDDFKLINDSLGHIKGDEVLIWISRFLESKTRNTDFVIRWGGDEFLIIFTQSNEEHKELLIKQVMSQLNEQSFKDLKIELNLSYGFSSSVNHESLNSLLSDADQKMYQNKAENKTKK